MKSIKFEPVVAIVCITILEAIALVKGIDGILLANIIAIIAGLGGYSLGKATLARIGSTEAKQQVDGR